MFLKGFKLSIRVCKKLVPTILVVGNEFLDTTSLHGFHWLAKNKKKYKGKVFNILVFSLWLISVLIGLFFALYLMVLVWIRYDISPIITTIETNNYPISNIPFPGVTICNINSVYKPNTFGVIKILKKNGISQEMAEMFLTNLSALINFKEVNKKYVNIFDILIDLGYNTSKLMLELSHPCKQMLKLCFWLGKSVPCKNIFRTTKSGFGYCCSFNYQALKNNFEIVTDMDEINQINSPLIRTSGAGEEVSLKVVLDVEADNYIAAKPLFYGTEIAIHDPEEFPEKSFLTAFGQQGTDVSISVRASVVDAFEDVSTVPVNRRMCRLENEKPLQIAKKYSFQSCITECRITTISNICKCLPFFYPSLKIKNETIQQCGMRDVECLYDNKHLFASLNTEKRFENIDIQNMDMTCDCLPSCSEKNYGADTFISNRVNGVGMLNTENSISNLSSIVVYFKDISCIKYRRELFKTWDDFLASFGGIFGLCLGGSVISLIEVLYFITFKLYEVYFTNGKADKVIRKNGNKRKQISLNAHRYKNHVTFNSKIKKLRCINI